MGSWLETCGFTGLPIFKGDSVRLILLGSHGNAKVARRSKATDLFYPIALPLKGTYDSYGGLGDGETMWNWLVYNFTRQHADMLTTSITQTWNVVCESSTISDFTSLFLRDGELSSLLKPGYSTSGVLVLESAYQWAVSEVGELADEISKELDKYIKLVREETKTDFMEIDRLHYLWNHLPSPLSTSIRCTSGVPEMVAALANTYQVDLEEVYQLFRRELEDFLKFDAIMGTLRKSYIPHQGSGSSSLYLKTDRRYYALCNKLLTTRIDYLKAERRRNR
jgi:hypothetical protein